MRVDSGILDDIGRLTDGEGGALLRLAATSARQVRYAWTLASEADLGALLFGGRPRAVVVAGVGTSALAARILAAVAGPTCPVPVIGHCTFGLPGWVGAADVVMAVSASGTSAETLSAAEEADRRGCRLLAVCPPGTPLAHLTERAHGSFVSVDHGSRGALLPPARAMLWSLAVPLLVAGRALGIVRDGEAAVEAAAVRLEETATRCRASSESFVNPAKMLALELAGSLPVLWGTSLVTAVAAERGVAQLSANAKYPALVGALPHPAHEQVAAFDGVFGARAGSAPVTDLDDFFRDRGDDDDDEDALRLRLVLLRDPADEHPLLGRQATAAAAVAAERGIAVTELAPAGTGALERLASLVGLLDFASIYLAFVLGIDPYYTLAAHDLGRGVDPRPLSS
jgi:hypothetical protein